MSNKAMKNISKRLNNNENVLIMVVGDSITWGCNHCSVEETFCAELAHLFAKRFPDTNVLRYDGVMNGENRPLERYEGSVIVNSGNSPTLTIVKSGVGGDSIKRAIARSQDYIGVFKTGERPDLFLLMFGINDSLPDPEKHATLQEFYDNYNELYNLIKKENSKAEIVFLTPTYNDPGENDKSSLDDYADIVKKFAKEKDCQIIDTHRLWMDHLIIGSEHHGQREWLSDNKYDCCHFPPAGSIATAEFIFNSL